MPHPPLQHPDHIKIDLRAHTVRIVGPMSKQEKAVCDLWVAQKQELVAKIEKLQEELESAQNILDAEEAGETDLPDHGGSGGDPQQPTRDRHRLKLLWLPPLTEMHDDRRRTRAAGWHARAVDFLSGPRTILSGQNRAADYAGIGGDLVVFSRSTTAPAMA